jgi:hypothetical protein
MRKPEQSAAVPGIKKDVLKARSRTKTHTHRISGKNLGQLAMPSFCPRCFWIGQKAPKGLPYQIFPGIFSSIDSYSKKVVHGWFDEHGMPPAWLAPLGPITGYLDPPGHQVFRTTHRETGILLTGAPDAVFTRPDGSLLIVDYKTARFTPFQDRLMPIYRVQLNAYAFIADAIGMGTVAGLALLYTEPVTDEAAAVAPESHRGDGFAMGFGANFHTLTLDTGILPPLLAQAKRLLDLEHAPEGRSGCKDCEKLGGVFGILR